MHVAKNKKKYLLHSDCTLIQNSDCCIPKLSPNSHIIFLWLRKFKCSFLVSSKNERSFVYFLR